MVHDDKDNPTLTALGDSWEVCAQGAKLDLILPVIDLTYDVEILSASVDGCIRISSPTRLAHLGDVRGIEQFSALKRRKEETGGCPTWSSPEDRLERGNDFAILGTAVPWLVRQQMIRSKELSVKYRLGDIPTTTDGWGLFLMAATMAAGGGEFGATVISPLIFCGAPGPAAIPAVNGVQVTRHAEVAALIANPKQKRIHQIGGGNSEVCFEPTLPVFLSTGEAVHTQVRQLWDAVGLATMHETEIPEIVPPPEAFFSKLRKTAMAAAGINHPLLDELVEFVTPLFLEKLWGKKPTAEESAFIARYGTFGGPCIMSQLVEKLPVIPDKIRGIRAAALAFARESPVGKKIAEEIQKPEYADLKALYASRPMGVVDGALGALADASLFAGLIGTSTMTMNALVQIHRGPEYLKMFQANSTAFMLETMRTATAVAGSLQATAEQQELTMAGEHVKLPAGSTIFQLTGVAAGLDASVFRDPYKFDSSRSNLGETMNFNGLTKHVLTRNYTGAPRFCPGAAVAIKIATKVTEYLVSHMA